MPRVLAVLLFLWAAFAATAEFPLEPRNRTEAVRSWREGQAVATNGNGTLVAWVDSRPNVDLDLVYGTQVRAMRFGVQGRRLDERDFAIGATGSNVHIATDGQDYMVAYDHPLLGVRFVLVPGGGGAPVPLVLDLKTQHRGLFYAGGYYFVFTGDLFVLDRKGNLVRPKLHLFWTLEPKDMLVADAGDGRVLFVWDRFLGQLASSVMTVDQLVDPRVQGFPAPVDLVGGWVKGLVRSADGFALLTIYRDDYKMNARLTMLDRHGRIAVPPRNLFEFPSWAIVANEFDETELFLAPSGTGYALVTDHHWGPGSPETRQMMHGAAFFRLDAAGRPLDSGFTRVTDKAGDVGAAGADDGTVWIAYEDGAATRIQHIDATGELLLEPPDPIASRSRASQPSASIERCAAFDLVVWNEVAADHSITRAQRFSRAGEPLGSIMALDPRSTEYEASVVCGRTTALATWTTAAGRRAAIIGTSGAPVPVDAAPSGSPMVFDGRFFVGPVFENEMQSGETVLRVHFRRWTEQGRFVEEALPKITLNAGTLHSAALGWNGSEFLLAWFTLDAPGLRPHGPLWTMRFNRELTPLGPPAEVRIQGEFAGVKSLAVSASPDQWLVAWVGGYLQIGWIRPLSEDWFVTTARIAADGSLLDPDDSAVSEWNAYWGLSQVSWNGVQWELVAKDRMGTFAPDGTMQLRTLLDDGATLAAVAPAGPRRLLVYTRVAPADGVAELFGDVRDESEWQPPGRSRRRASRH